MFGTQHSQPEANISSLLGRGSISFYFYKHQCPDGTVVPTSPPGHEHGAKILVPLGT